MKDLEQLLEVEQVNVGGTAYKIDVQDYLNVDPTRLDYEFAVHTKRVALIGFAYERAISYVQQLEIELERIYALCDERERANLAAVLGSKRPTETMVENAVKTSHEYQEKQGEVLVAKRDLGLLKALHTAMLHRKDVLVGLSANYRAELQNEPTISQRY